MSNDDARTLWCGNLSDEVTDQILYELFIQVGPVEKVVVPVDSNGNRRSYGFIIFRHECSVPYALKLLRGTVLCDKKLDLQYKIRSSSRSRSTSMGGYIKKRRPRRASPSSPCYCDMSTHRFCDVSTQTSGKEVGHHKERRHKKCVILDDVNKSRPHLHLKMTDHVYKLKELREVRELTSATSDTSNFTRLFRSLGKGYQKYRK